MIELNACIQALRQGMRDAAGADDSSDGRTH